ncbi:Tyrosine-protein kinase receptor TYRO3 [Nymphon striatum]|nr:Tyrosine-protein kinase receptor TYRO3 [Nymphon striatum]
MKLTAPCRSSGDRDHKFQFLVGNIFAGTISTVSFVSDIFSSCLRLIFRVLIFSSKSYDETSLTGNLFPPQINLINSFASQNALKEGDRTTFKCTIMSNPMVQEIKWYFEGREVSKLFPDESINNDTMTLKSVSRRHIGRYWCSASNLEGRRSSNKIKLMIQYVPSCNVPRQTISVSLNQEARPTCIVKADPQEVTFSWIFNNSKESFEIMSYSENGLTSIATFVPQNRNQFGWLSCKARNSVGIQRDACIFVLKEAGPPAKLENCMVLNRTSTSIHVKCKPGHDGGMLQRFQMEVYEKWLHTPTVNVTSIDYPEFVANNLPSHKDFTMLIYALNNKGKSMSYVLHSSTLRDPQKQSKSSGSIIASSFIRGVCCLVGETIPSIKEIASITQIGIQSLVQRLYGTLQNLLRVIDIVCGRHAQPEESAMADRKSCYICEFCRLFTYLGLELDSKELHSYGVP